MFLPWAFVLRRFSCLRWRTLSSSILLRYEEQHFAIYRLHTAVLILLWPNSVQTSPVRQLCLLFFISFVEQSADNVLRSERKWKIRKNCIFHPSLKYIYSVKGCIEGTQLFTKYISPVRWSELWLKLAEKHSSGWIVVREKYYSGWKKKPNKSNMG